MFFSTFSTFDASAEAAITIGPTLMIFNDSELKITIYLGLISDIESYVTYFSFDSKLLVWMNFNPFGFGLYRSDKKIVVSNDCIGRLRERFIFGIF